MPNDTLDEIEARWKSAPFTLADRKPTIEELEAILQSEPQGKITIEPNGEVSVEPWTLKQAASDMRTLTEMVRSRDVEIEQLHQIIDCLEWLKAKHDAALDTPPAQEQKR